MVKNESAIIKRCLESVLPLVDGVFVLDTGSSDPTFNIAVEAAKGFKVDYAAEKTKWKGFGPTRNELIKKATAAFPGAWLLLVDADYVLETNIRSADELSKLLDPKFAAYSLSWTGALLYSNTKILNSDYPWAYIGRTHEYLECPTEHKLEHLKEIKINEQYDGSNRSHKFQRDVDLLKLDLADPEYPLKSRAEFYIARSYFDMERYDEALPWFIKSANNSTWDQQRYMSYLQAGRCAIKLGQDYLHFLAAANYEDPTRPEAIYELMLHELRRKNYDKVILVWSSSWLEDPLMKDWSSKLFIETYLLEWRLFDAAAMGYWHNENPKGKEKAKALWYRALEKVPKGSDRDRIEENITKWC